MTLVRDRALSAARGVTVAQGRGGLEAIGAESCAAAIWQRDLPPGFADWIGALAPKELPSGRVILRPGDAAAVLTELSDAVGLPDGPERAFLLTDIAALCETFAGIMKARWIRLRLQPVSTNSCRKFHRDAVTARLVCTYRGTGTQYGTALGGGDPQRVFTVPTGAPIMLRGTLWQEMPHSGLLHRSPPIEGSGETRLLCVIDPVDDPEDDL
ncbi:DUF1826 domain-containing protein [Roseovarius aquimarinus]|uniref:DUF1826 domain-containing protein n=1 Tax=Roseovarius aquimarinus TaxID=1229156 RepID=A0ABW7I4D5_9RHOB